MTDGRTTGRTFRVPEVEQHQPSLAVTTQLPRLAIEISQTAVADDLCVLAEADSRGRVCPDPDKLLAGVKLANNSINNSYSLTPLLGSAQAVTGRKYSFTELCENTGNGTKQFAIRDERYKVLYNGQAWEMFDLQKGPRLLEFNLFGEAKEGSNAFADSYSLTMSGLGGDPFPTALPRRSLRRRAPAHRKRPLEAGRSARRSRARTAAPRSEPRTAARRREAARPRAA